MTKNTKAGASPGDAGSRSNPSEPKPLVRALKETNWNEILPELLTYAERRLRRFGWGSGPKTMPAAADARQLVHEAIRRSLDGARTWNEDDPPDLVAFLCNVIRSIASSERKSRERQGPMEPLDSPSTQVQLQERGVSPEDAMLEDGQAAARLKEIEACIGDDVDLASFYTAVVDEGWTKREQIAEGLGWTPEKVSVVYKKLTRRLERAEAKRST